MGQRVPRQHKGKALTACVQYVRECECVSVCVSVGGSGGQCASVGRGRQHRGCTWRGEQDAPTGTPPNSTALMCASALRVPHIRLHKPVVMFRVPRSYPPTRLVDPQATLTPTTHPPTHPNPPTRPRPRPCSRAAHLSAPARRRSPCPGSPCPASACQGSAWPAWRG